MDISSLIENLLKQIGEDPKREGLQETPRRVESMYKELLTGYDQDPKEIFKSFKSDNYQGNVIVSDIFFSSFCEHHMLPFFGHTEIEYKPNGKVIGLSKLVRLVEIYSNRLQIQERLTQEIADSLMKNLEPIGCRVTIEAEHLCMSLRGVKKPGTLTTTETIVGSLK